MAWHLCSLHGNDTGGRTCATSASVPIRPRNARGAAPYVCLLSLPLFLPMHFKSVRKGDAWTWIDAPFLVKFWPLRFAPPASQLCQPHSPDLLRLLRSPFSRAVPGRSAEQVHGPSLVIWEYDAGGTRGRRGPHSCLCAQSDGDQVSLAQVCTVCASTENKRRERSRCRP